MNAAAAPLAPEIVEALAASGVVVAAFAPVSSMGGRKGRREAYRIASSDGRVVKARHMESPEVAEQIAELRAGLEPAFAPIIVRHRAVLLEEWIEGTPLGAADAEGRAAEAGALLGRLHVLPPPAGTPPVAPTRRWCQRAGADLDILGGAGRLALADADALRVAMARDDPGQVASVRVHQDFCAENMIIDGQGRLRVIDNEQMGVAPAGYDLGRTADRWPMSPVAWTAFLGGYRSSGAALPAGLDFWTIAAALTGARVRLQRSPARLPAVIEVLRGLAVRGGA